MVKEKYAIVTGSDGLVGSESVKYFSNLGFKVIGIDNNSRKIFGEDASTLKNRHRLKKEVKNFSHFNYDVTSNKIEEIFKKYKDKIKLVIHTAAQLHTIGLPQILI